MSAKKKNKIKTTHTIYIKTETRWKIKRSFLYNIVLSIQLQWVLVRTYTSFLSSRHSLHFIKDWLAAGSTCFKWLQQQAAWKRLASVVFKKRNYRFRKRVKKKKMLWWKKLMNRRETWIWMCSSTPLNVATTWTELSTFLLLFFFCFLSFVLLATVYGQRSNERTYDTCSQL